MENNNSKITEEYKAEITDILSKISQGLGESVINSIEPKISSYTTSLDNSFNSIHEINNKQKSNFEKTSNLFNNLDDKVNSLSKKLGSDELSKKITTDIKIFEQNFIKDNKSNKEEVINEIHKGNSKIKELISQQKEFEIILQNLKNINSQQSVLLESFEGKSIFTNENLSEIKKSIDASNNKIEKEKLILNNSITANNKLIKQTKDHTEELIVNQLLNFVTKINNNNINQLKEHQIKQERKDKLIYFLIFITLIILIMILYIILIR